MIDGFSNSNTLASLSGLAALLVHKGVHVHLVLAMLLLHLECLKSPNHDTKGSPQNLKPYNLNPSLFS